MPVTYEPIVTTTLASNAGAGGVTLSSISSTYTDLILIANTKDVRSNVTNTDMSARVNGDTGANYSWNFMRGDGSTVASARGSNQTIFYAGMGSGSNFVVSVWTFNNYSNSSTNKNVIVKNNAPDAGSVRLGIGTWRNTSAINSITIYGEQGFVAGSTFTLFGIKAA